MISSTIKSKGNILVVDDEDIICETFRLFLESEGFKVITAHSGAEALKLINTHAFEVLILDVLMPGMNGLEVMRKIKKKANSPEIIISTGAGSHDINIEAMRLGAFDFLSKPILNLEGKLLRSICKAKEHYQLKSKVHNQSSRIKSLEQNINNILHFNLKLLRVKDDNTLIKVFSNAVKSFYPSIDFVLLRAVENELIPLGSKEDRSFHIPVDAVLSTNTPELPFALPKKIGVFPLKIAQKLLGVLALGGLDDQTSGRMPLFALLPSLSCYFLSTENIPVL